ncbi:hypothetical protein GGTG_08463 [Gaeumannomyces tritici R3-111a-1]|uniref:Uncharacterized protein n=1 Tax=Gaeumannomyces tritici (strain R3-111a-1) TaxID=644352 RepID=J3P4M6_GAET3|nr:hypothetical protein GGTG_08463 [Gaeumannomyces tritici R3-111a-1]EJT74623.1 hypothetical protein GGTG_08463 [Gaeumannomyces tritici R3-111a-1]
MVATSQDGGLSAGPISVIFEVLPTSIQAIIPPIPSLRRSVSQRRMMKATSFLPAALFVLQSQTPLPAADSLRPLSTDDVSLVVEEDMESTTDESTTTADPRDIAQYSTPRQVRPREVVEYAAAPPQPRSGGRMGFQFLRLSRRSSSTASSSASSSAAPGASAGIDRKFQRRGRELLRDSEAEADPSNPDPNPAFERRAYLDGIAYLLQGLPRDLDEVEVSILRGSLPDPLRHDANLRQRNGLTNGGDEFQRSSGLSSPELSAHGGGESVSMLRLRGAGPSPVHRTVRTLMTGLIFMLRLFLSVFATAVQEVVRVGNEYQIPERVTRQTMFMASSFASMGTSAASTIGSVSKASYAMVDDRVGNGLGTILRWVADETIAGVCDGLRDGLRYQLYQEGQ